MFVLIERGLTGRNSFNTPKSLELFLLFTLIEKLKALLGEWIKNSFNTAENPLKVP